MNRLIPCLFLLALVLPVQAQQKFLLKEIQFTPDYKIVVDGEVSYDIDQVLKANPEVQIVAFKVRGEVWPSNYKWRFMQAGYYEAELLLDYALVDTAEYKVFVRAPVSMQDAWKKVEPYVENKEEWKRHEFILSYARLVIDEKRGVYQWSFNFGLKKADGGASVHYSILDKKMSDNWLP